MSEADPRPIGVFDSGVGGLTVLKAARERLPDEQFVYLGDTARLPYGTKSPATVLNYALRAAAFLTERDIKLLVVACNTASAVALPELSARLAPLPVIGVVEPGARAAVEARPGGRHLVLATEATVRLHAYRKAVSALDSAANVAELACEMLVALAEEGWTDGDIATAIVRRYLDQLDGNRSTADCVILGCTHFPLLQSAIAAALEPGTTIVDSASTTASAAAGMLSELGIANEQGSAGRLTLLATDGATRFARVGGRFLGEDLDAADITLVDL